MNSYELFMDVSGDIMPQIAKENDLHLVPMEFIIDDEAQTYNYFDSGLDLEKFYDEIKKKVNIKTTQITPAIYEEIFDSYLKGGKSILYLCLSSGLSSTYQSACMASKNLKEKYPNADLVVIDSMAATAAMGIMAERMIENRKKGMSILDNKTDIENNRTHIDTYGSIGDLVMLKRGGRISSATAFFGNLLNIKPIVQIVNSTGTLKVPTKTNGSNAGIKWLFKYYTEHRDENYNFAYICHSNEEENAQLLENMIKESFPNVDIRKRLISPIIGAHLGPGSILISFYCKQQ